MPRQFPATRLRRLRAQEFSRRLVREAGLAAPKRTGADGILTYFGKRAAQASGWLDAVVEGGALRP